MKTRKMCNYEVDNYLGNGIKYTQKEIRKRRKELNLEDWYKMKEYTFKIEKEYYADSEEEAKEQFIWDVAENKFEIKTVSEDEDKYKKGFEILIKYFDSISEEEKPKVDERLKEVGLWELIELIRKDIK